MLTGCANLHLTALKNILFKGIQLSKWTQTELLNEHRNFTNAYSSNSYNFLFYPKEFYTSCIHTRYQFQNLISKRSWLRQASCIKPQQTTQLGITLHWKVHYFISFMGFLIFNLVRCWDFVWLTDWKKTCLTNSHQHGRETQPRTVVRGFI